ncbi:membrane integrity-associated transporter subunit PqiC [Ramlibacter sp. USB13]|uniref:Membrane integrity-associated transporter subunit PqiC n=1 Tax=Ramlibacter cellulosilyticus TaxID=2764187 RepID=A0A923MU26_9BURK|nr:ABC-type transport auxiliary lipoprotein family protein [Ramlibacter cellulosilyticus]MBC5785031.1 membrane integrity-associated transporter subunit PqiC [Ramlibacter cellulosilyticus]
MNRASPWILAAVLAGCAFAPAADAPTSLSVLDQLPADVPRHARTHLTLVVFPPEARPSIDTVQMAYTSQPHALAYFARHRWAERPPQMLQPLLVRTLEATGAFTAVVGPPLAGNGTLALRTELTQLVQDFTSDPPVVQLSLRVRLSDDRAQKVLGTREMALRETMQQKSPAAGAAAANAALARALRETAQFVLERMP